MKVRDIMTTPAITVRPETALKRVAETMLRHAISIVPVVDEAGGLRGILSEADLLRMQTTPGEGEILFTPPREGAVPGTAGAVMTRDVVATGEEAEVSDLLRVMVERGIKGVPVISSGEVTGVVGRRDILRLLARTDAEIHQDVSGVLDRVGEEPFSIDVTEGVVTVNRWMSSGGRRRVEQLIKTVPGALAVVFKE
ncbi:MAG: CBS domain-containing protein [Actinomycetota bacterium]